MASEFGGVFTKMPDGVLIGKSDGVCEGKIFWRRGWIVV